MISGICGAVTITGKVVDDEGPVAYANVYIIETEGGGATDIDGRYSIEVPEFGEYTLQFSATGLRKERVVVQVDSDPMVYDFKMQVLDTELNEVVVTGTLKETFIGESPVKVEILTAEFFKNTPNNNLMEAIQNVNGVQEQINCGVCATNDIHINGMEGPYTLLLIDGMPIVSGLASVYGFNGIPTSLIERVEIIKGPSSTLYGTEAVGGVINVITKSSQNLPLAFLNTFYTTHQEFNADLAVAPRIVDKVSTVLSVNYYDNQYRMDFNGDNFTDIPLNNRISLFNKWQFQSESGLRSSLAVRYYKEDRFGGVMEWTDAFRGSDSIYGESIYTERIEVIGSLRFTENIKLDLSYNTHDQDSYYGDTWYKADQQVLFGNLLWTKEAGRHDVIVGLTSRYNTYTDNSPGETDDAQFIPGVFVQDEFAITDRASLLGGIRFDHHNAHGLIISPRLNWKQKLGTYTTMRVNLGTGFRQVNLFTEDHAALTGSRQVLIQSELQPEESYNATLNLNHVYVLGEGVGTLDVDIFYTYFTNKIVPDYETDPNLIIYDNLQGYGITRGASVSVNHTFQCPLSVKIGATLQDVYQVEENESGVEEKTQQIFAPLISGTFGIGYKLKKAGLHLSYTGRVMGPQHLPTYDAPFNRAEISPWWTIQNFQITKTFEFGLEAYVAVKNIFNYTQGSPLIDPANPFGDDFDTAYAYGPLQERRYVFGLRYSLAKK